MVSSEKDQRLKLHWEGIRKRGRVFNLILNVLIFLGGYALVRILHVFAFQVGLLRSPGSTSWEDVLFSAIFTGVIFAELEWSDLKRKFKSPPPQEDWMAK